MNNKDLMIQIDTLQDGAAVLDSKAVCTCNGGGTSCCSCAN